MSNLRNSNIVDHDDTELGNRDDQLRIYDKMTLDLLGSILNELKELNHNMRIITDEDPIDEEEI